MSFDIIPFQLAAALANAGTVTVNYPTGRTKGDYLFGASGLHKLVVGQNVYSAPTNFTLAFNANASNMTLTNTNMGTIAANTQCTLQAERPDVNSQYGRVEPSGATADRVTPGRPFIIELGSPNALNTSGICASQSVTAGTAALLNGTGTDVTIQSDGSAALGVARNVTAAWTTTSVMTVVGKDILGNTMSEASASGTSFTGKKAFKSITSINFSISVTSCTVGYGDVLGLPVAVHNASQIISEVFGNLNVGGRPQKVRIPYALNQVDLLAGSTNSYQLMIPFAGTITLINTIVQKAITTGGTILIKNAAAATVVGSTVTIANAATQGTSQLVTPTAGDASAVCAKNDIVQIVPASFATAGEVTGFIEVTPAENALVSGTLVIAEVLKATTTTGDVRGTYKPELATDGTSAIVLIALVPDPSDVGSTQA